MTVNLDHLPFIQARWFYRGRRIGIELIVLHDMEAPETDTMAESVARNFAVTPRKVSAHYCVDNDSVVQCVKDSDTAWTAPGANANGLHVEHAGYASQRREDWQDGYSSAELALSAMLVRSKCNQYGIPKEFVDVAGLKAGKKGITTHAAVSQAFKLSDHTDPGPGFPMDVYLAMVRSGVAITAAPLLPPQLGARPVINAPVVAIGRTPTSKGYWLVSADGGVFNFGDAKFWGSTGNVKLSKPIVGMVVSETGLGYGLVASDGGVFAFGDFEFLGSVEYRG